MSHDRREDDLPSEVQEQLVPERIGTMLREALEASEVPMSVNDLIKALWRNHGVVQKRPNVISALHRLKDNGSARRCGRGSWAANKENRR